jgi:hypothetical protein
VTSANLGERTIRRIQLSHAKGWKIADHSTNYVVVDRRTIWGNPWTLRRAGKRHTDVLLNNRWPSLGTFDTPLAARRFAVEQHRRWLTDDVFAAGLPGMGRFWVLKHLVEELGGRDLACWCPLPAAGEDDVCHARVLMDLSTGSRP